MKKVLVLVGAPASGKSTFANDYANTHPNTIVLSSDRLREEYYGNENIQDNPAFIFKVIRERLDNFLKFGYNVIVDATNMNRKSRKGYITIAKKHQAEINAVVFAVSYEECLRRNVARERKVPKHIIERMISRFEIPTRGEGFNTVIVRNGEIKRADAESILKVFESFGDQKIITILLRLKHIVISANKLCKKWVAIIPLALRRSTLLPTRELGSVSLG